MKDFYFLTGVAAGALIGMCVGAKNKQVKEAVLCGEKKMMEAADEIKDVLTSKPKPKAKAKSPSKSNASKAN